MRMCFDITYSVLEPLSGMNSTLSIAKTAVIANTDSETESWMDRFHPMAFSSEVLVEDAGRTSLILDLEPALVCRSNKTV